MKDYISKKIYLAGHTGMVGSAILRELQSRGYKNIITKDLSDLCLLYTSPSPRDRTRSRMPSSA